MSWREHAACKDAPTDLFFPKNGGSVASALVYCDGCEVREACLRDALSTAGDYTTSGVWGGTSTGERVSGRPAPKTGTCPRCGVTFRKPRPTQRYCSGECRSNAASAAYYSRRKAS